MAEKPIEETIDDLFEKAEFLNESSSPETINGYLVLLEYCLSRYKQIDPMLQREYYFKLIDLRVELLTLGRMINNNSMVVASLDPSKLEITSEKLGEGSYGAVYRGKLAGNPVAVKMIKPKNNDSRAQILREATVMSKINNASIVRFFGVTVSGDYIIIVSDLCEGDLKRISSKGRGSDSQAFLRRAVRWLCQAARGLTWMHDVCCMIHGDVKPENFLLKNGDALITDFGFTRAVKSEGELLQCTVGSPYYDAPEIFREEPFSLPIDVYAFGISIFEILYGDVPFTKRITTYDQLADYVIRGGRPDLNRLAGFCPNSLMKLMVDCWEEDPDVRPKMREVYERLKAIYIETIIPRSSPVFDFWLRLFGDDITDQVPYERFANAMRKADGDDANEKLLEDNRRILLGIPCPTPPDCKVTLKDLSNRALWYGNWLNDRVLLQVVDGLNRNKWFVGAVDRGVAESAVQQHYLKSGNHCFLVRCSTTDPVNNPFTITVCDGALVNHRITRTSDGKFCCTTIGDPSSPKIIRKRSIFHLIQAFREAGYLGEPCESLYSTRY